MIIRIPITSYLIVFMLLTSWSSNLYNNTPIEIEMIQISSGIPSHPGFKGTPLGEHLIHVFSILGFKKGLATLSMPKQTVIGFQKVVEQAQKAVINTLNPVHSFGKVNNKRLITEIIKKT